MLQWLYNFTFTSKPIQSQKSENSSESRLKNLNLKPIESRNLNFQAMKCKKVDPSSEVIFEAKQISSSTKNLN